MSVWVFEASLAVLFFAVVLPLAVVPLVNRVYRAHGRFAAWPAIFASSSVAMACALVAFTLFPLPTELDCDRRSNFDYWSLRPFASTSRFGEIVSESGPVGLVTSGPFLQVLFNVALFVPIGFLIHQQSRWRIRTVLLVGAAISVAVELTQGTAIFGAYECPYRVAEFDDLVWNTTGVVLGAAASVWAVRHLSFVDAEPSPDVAPPTLRRRTSAAALDVVVFVIVGTLLQILANVAASIIAGRDTLDHSVLDVVRLVLSGPVAALFVGLVIPLVRSDRATPGQAAVDIRPVGDASTDPSEHSMLARRWLVRWLAPAVLPGAWPLVGWVVEWLVARRRDDGRSVSGVVARSTTVTTRSLDVD